MQRRWFLWGAAALGCGSTSTKPAPVAVVPRNDSSDKPAQEKNTTTTDSSPGRRRYSGESPLNLAFEEQLGLGFLLVSVDLWLDGVQVGSWNAERDYKFDPLLTQLAIRGHIMNMASLKVTQGEHEAQILVKYDASGEEPLSQLKGYKFDIRSKHKIEAPRSNAPWTLRAIAFERATPTAPIEERVTLSWDFSPSPAGQGT